MAWAPLALLVFLEEWGWRPLARAMGRLARWAPIARFEARLKEVSPGVALALFIVPAVALFPVKLLALWAIQQGHAVLGLSVIIAAKLLGTALLGRLFVLTEPQLRRYAWLARALDAWSAYKDRIKAWLHASAAWRAAAAAGTVLRRRWRRLIGRGA